MSAKELATMACEVALSAPLYRDKYAREARIPWDLVERIRAALDEIGVDWRKAKEKANG